MSAGDKITVRLDDLRAALEEVQPIPDCHCERCTAFNASVKRLTEAVDNWRHPFDCGIEGCQYRMKYQHVHAGDCTYGRL